MAKTQRRHRQAQRAIEQSTPAAKSQDTAPEHSFLVETLADIVAGHGSAKSKVVQIRKLISAQTTTSSDINQVDTDIERHPIRSMHDQIQREFDHKDDVAILAPSGSKTGLEQELDKLLAQYDVRPKRLRGEISRTFAAIIQKVERGEDLEREISAVAKFGSKESVSLDVSSLPEKAPILYKNRPDKKQNIVEFLLDDRFWGRWVKAGVLGRHHLRQRDFGAYQMLTRWLKNNDLPQGISILTKSQAIDKLLETVSVRGPLPSGSTLLRRQKARQKSED